MLRFVFVLAMAVLAATQLTLGGSQCGQLRCQPDEYCSSETSRCAPCDRICNKTNHNFDSGLCVKACQEYLLDLRYERRTEEKIDSQADYSSIQRQARAALIVSSVALALLVLILIINCRNKLSWTQMKQKLQPSKKRIKQYPIDLIHRNPHAEIPPRPKHELKLDIPKPEPPKRQNQQPLNVAELENSSPPTDIVSVGATTPKTISTALSNRHPAEDTTLDFSYDNMALNVTPPEQPGANRRF